MHDIRLLALVGVLALVVVRFVVQLIGLWPDYAGLGEADRGQALVTPIWLLVVVVIALVLAVALPMVSDLHLSHRGAVLSAAGLVLALLATIGLVDRGFGGGEP